MAQTEVLVANNAFTNGTVWTVFGGENRCTTTGDTHINPNGDSSPDADTVEDDSVTQTMNLQQFFDIDPDITDPEDWEFNLFLRKDEISSPVPFFSFAIGGSQSLVHLFWVRTDTGAFGTETLSGTPNPTLTVSSFNADWWRIRWTVEGRTGTSTWARVQITPARDEPDSAIRSVILWGASAKYGPVPKITSVVVSDTAVLADTSTSIAIPGEPAPGDVSLKLLLMGRRPLRGVGRGVR